MKPKSTRQKRESKTAQHKHEPDWGNMMIARDCIRSDADGDTVHFIIDVGCKTCGTSGSFGIDVAAVDVNW